MNAGTHVLSLLMDGQPVTGQDKLYATAALDQNTGEVILKIVNAASEAAQTQLNIAGLGKKRIVLGKQVYLHSDDLKTTNTMEYESIVPRVRPFTISGKEIELDLPAYSFTVYRLQIR